MCGIAGIFGPTGDRNRGEIAEIVGKMSDRLRHRGPDSAGIWVDTDNGIAFGFRRLAVQDTSESGNQPMHSTSGRYVTVLNGEIYNFKDLKCTLEGKGHRFRGCSDTEVLLASIDEWGLDATLDRIHGMFAFALWDRNKGCLKLVRDRLGEKPLFYSMAGGKFIFASELKALHECPWWRPAINRESLHQYFRFNYVPDPLCIYEDTKKLFPGCVLTIHFKSSPNLNLKPYWQLSNNSSELSDCLSKERPGQIVDQFHNILYDSVKRQLISDVPLGVFLSGGIDSSLITALAQEASTTPVKTFTVGFRELQYDESRYASEVAKILNTEHTEVILGEEDALDLIPELPTIYDEPFGDSSQLPTILVSRIARKYVTVALGGDGGDEIMAGYPRYFDALRRLKNMNLYRARARLKANMLRSLGWLISHEFVRKTLDGKGAYCDWRFLNRKIDSLDNTSCDRMPVQIYSRFVSHWIDSMNPAGGATLLSRRIESEDSLWLIDPLKAMMLFDAESYLPGDILTKVDRAAMSVSLETRSPMLDHDVVEFCLGVPSRYHAQDGSGKWLSRSLLKRYLPDHIVNRKKTGFAAPIDEWLRGPLVTWADTLFKTMGFYKDLIGNEEAVLREWQWHKKGRTNRGHALWGVLMFLDWMQVNRH